MRKNRKEYHLHRKDNLIEKFTKMRNDLIDQLESGKLDKSLYLEAQYQGLSQLGMNPMTGRLKSVEMGLFNYQYYNILAKRERILSKAEEYRNPELSRMHRKNADKYYECKDRETKKIIELYGIENIQAYKIKTPARYLEGKLIELILPTVERAVLHTADEGIFNHLDRAGVVESEIKKSIIHHYIEADYDSV